MLVHGLMGRGSTWSRQLPWLTRFGAVYTYDAPWHRGRDVDDPAAVSTERFVADLADAVAVRRRRWSLIGHSMGGLHSWCLAARHPDLVSALVVEDMAPDFVGRTTGPWEPWLHACRWSSRSADEVFDEFGPVAGQYFLEAFDRTATGWRLHGQAGAVDRDRRRVGHPATTGSSGTRWARPRCSSRRRLGHPAGADAADAELAGSRATYVQVPGAGHLIHDDAPRALPGGRRRRS